VDLASGAADPASGGYHQWMGLADLSIGFSFFVFRID
jgi:hypothetical protein